MNTIPFVDFFAPTPNIKTQIAGVKMFYLDGSTSEIELHVPNVTRDGDAYDYAKNHLEAYVCFLSAHYIKIRGYQFYRAYIDDNGVKNISCQIFTPEEIPANKVWHENEGWIDLPKARTPEEYFALRKRGIYLP
ncbi:hypothetical protein [Niabella ginsenosidivorans]|nr:hypothetical protein [Niabella ginsenosidivorans]